MPPSVNPVMRIALHERNQISTGLLASDLVAGAVEVPPAELAKLISARVLELILIMVDRQREESEPSLPEERQYWLQGRAIWRKHFEALAHDPA